MELISLHWVEYGFAGYVTVMGAALAFLGISREMNTAANVCWETGTYRPNTEILTL